MGAVEIGMLLFVIAPIVILAISSIYFISAYRDSGESESGV